MFRHLAPNCVPPLIVVATVQIANAISLEATLSFLGLGLPVTEPPMSSPVLEVDGLVTEFATRAGALRAVDGVSFALSCGEVMGLVGESGSGKSVTGLSLMGLVDAPGRIAAGSIRLDGHDLVGLPPRERASPWCSRTR